MDYWGGGVVCSPPSDARLFEQKPPVTYTRDNSSLPPSLPPPIPLPCSRATSPRSIDSAAGGMVYPIHETMLVTNNTTYLVLLCVFSEFARPASTRCS